ncbi:hypothetical protein ACU684_11760 [Pseudomonas sp. LF135]
MSKTKYPYMAWVLMPSFKPKEIEIVREGSRSNHYQHTDRNSSGKHYALSDLHETKADAVSAGLAKLEVQREAQAKRQESIDKKAAELAKHQ